MSEPQGSSISTSLRLIKALGLARRGRFKDAEALLAAEGTVPDDRVALHTLAALVTSEGDYSRALRLWRLLQQREPNHAEARHMIETIETWESRPPWFRFIPLGTCALLAVILAACLMWTLSGPEPVPKPKLVSDPVVAAPPPAQRNDNPTVTIPSFAKPRKTR